MVLEQEMKIPVRALAAVRARLRRGGATLLHRRALEDNWVLDDASGSMAAGGRLLRVRRVGTRGTVTLKGAAAFAAGVKSRTETEAPIGDVETAFAALAVFGYKPVRRYQKRREEWSLDGVTVALDDTPMGSFVELEGRPELLAVVASGLGLDPRAASRGTYLDLWAAYRADHPGAPRDMVFPPAIARTRRGKPRG